MITFSELSQKYLNWCKTHRSPRLYEWYANYLNMFCAWPGISETDAYAVKPYQVQEWIDSHNESWGDNYKRGAVVALKRIYHWAEELGYGEGNPIKKLKAPSATRRKDFVKQDSYEAILRHIDKEDPFMDFLLFVYNTGSRPQEARHIEPRHVFLGSRKIIFPAKESKGKKVERVIRLNDVAFEIIERLMKKYSDGKLFRNTRGDAWTKYSICNRFNRLSEVIGKRVFCYGLRHAYASRKLVQGHDHLVVASLLGHTDGSMLARVYSHIDEDDEFMQKALLD